MYCGDRTAATDGYISWDRFPALKKFQDNRRANLTAQEGGKVQVLLRLGEVYLIAAEAALGLGQHRGSGDSTSTCSASARRRRRTRPTRASWSPPGRSTSIFIMDERERELSGEFNRWYDLVRPGAQFFVDRVKKYNPHGGVERGAEARAPPDPAVADRRRGAGPEVSAEPRLLGRKRVVVTMRAAAGLAIACLAAATTPAEAQQEAHPHNGLRLPRVFGDGMVVQRDVPNPGVGLGLSRGVGAGRARIRFCAHDRR